MLGSVRNVGVSSGKARVAQEFVYVPWYLGYQTRDKVIYRKQVSHSNSELGDSGNPFYAFCEEWYAVSVRTVVVQNAVQCAPISASCPGVYQVTNVDNKCILNGWNWYPLARRRIEHLKARKLGLLKKEGKAAKVRVRTSLDEHQPAASM
ncbi:hypothetical protein M8818_005566 [Zalaria obscura]|uniref:Uncharacterized protein n=1 Tax=Zalaria obscura TaxID=2024903 RepID=A0ACC3S8B4_9PEZI